MVASLPCPPGKIPEPMLWSWMRKWQLSLWAIFPLQELIFWWGGGEAALSNLKSSWLSSPAMEFLPHEAGKGQWGLQYSQYGSLRLSLHAVSRGWVEEVRHYLLTTVTQDLGLAMGSWGQDEKCWSLASHGEKTLWLGAGGEGTLCYQLQKSGVQLPNLH